MKKIFLLALVFLSWVLAADIHETEPNNYFSTANNITINDVGYGSLYYYNRRNYDVDDFWKFTAPENGILKIYTTDSVANINGYVYNENYNLIGFDDSINKNISISLYVQKNQTYYLDLNYYSWNYTDYKLHFEFTPKDINVSTNERDFKLRKSFNIHGNSKVIGNSVLCYKINGKCVNTDYPNNDLYLSYINLENNSSIYNSSQAYISDIPNDAEILYVGFYTQGDRSDMYEDQLISYLATNPSYLISPQGKYYKLYPSVIDVYPFGIIGEGGVYTFSTFTEVKDLESNSTHKVYGKDINGWWTGANIPTQDGYNRALGYFGAWSMVVVYRYKDETYKNISIFDGYKRVSKDINHKKVTINVSGFLTPLNGPINSKLSLFVGEGDKAYTGDTLSVDGKYINKTNAFDSTINGFSANPLLTNTFGIDIHNYDIGSSGYNIIKNGQTDANITMTSDGDAYYPNMILFSTDLYVPKVCYDNLELYKDGKLVDSNTKLQVGDTIQIKFNVKNMSYQEAKDVYIINNDDNLTKYVQNSTIVKNVLSNKFKKLIDNDLSSNPHVIYKNGIWNVGIIGDENNTFKSTLLNSAYNATVELNKTIEKEGNLSFDFYTDYNYTIGNQFFTYNDYLPKCEEFNNNYSAYNTLTGTFDAFDINKSLSDKHITTKIVNKPFTLKIVSLNAENNGLETQSDKFAKFALWDMINNTNITNWYDFNASQYSEIDKIFTINKAYKNVKVMFKFCAKKTNNGYDFYPYNDCVKNGFEINCVDENDTSICIRRSVSSDAFAIRPDKFIIDIASLPHFLQSGEDYNLTIKAVDFNGSAVKNYNEILKINNPNSPTLEYKETKNGCLRGILSSNPTEIHFLNGEANLSLKYSEVGDINLTVKEINGSEFAKIDANDTNWNNRKIADANVTLHFIPYEFNLTANYNNFNNSNFTYISNDLNMSSVLDLNIKAINKSGLVTQNYNKNCYAKNIDINISHSIPSNNLNILYEVNGTEYNISKNQNIVANNVTKNYFNSGVANIQIHINFERKPNTPINEFNFTVKDINISDVDNVEGNISLDKNVTFKYGRIKVSDASAYSRDINTTFEYQYWSNNGWIVNNEHNSSIFGDFNKTKSILLGITVSNNPIINNGKETVVFSTTHALPYSAKVHLAIPSWLWYHPLAKSYKAPSSSNLDCLTHPCFKLNFLETSSAYGGVSAITNSKFNVNNRTSEINSSRSEINVSKSQLNKINW